MRCNLYSNTLNIFFLIQKLHAPVCTVTMEGHIYLMDPLGVAFVKAVMTELTVNVSNGVTYSLFRANI